MDTPAKVELLLELMKFSDAQLRREFKALENLQQTHDDRKVREDVRETVLREVELRMGSG